MQLKGIMNNKSIKEPKTILFVDDVEMVAEVGKAMLEFLGYKVVVANGGQMAIDIVSKIGNTLDLIILDLVMPGINGSMAYDIIRENCPKIPVLLSSGYSLKGTISELLQKGCYGFIQKPFDINELSQKIDLIFSMDAKSGQVEHIPS